MAKKHKKKHARRDSSGAWHGRAGDAGGQAAGDWERGLLDGMPAFLRARKSEQFLLGALLGAAAIWVLTDEELRAKLIKAGMKLYSNLAGGFEEMKEQMADIRAEIAAEQPEDA